jgi:hypothetical protein
VFCGFAVQFEALDNKVNASLTKLFEARRRRDMYLGFAEDPVSFLNTIVASQVGTVAGDTACLPQPAHSIVVLVCVCQSRCVLQVTGCSFGFAPVCWFSQHTA